MKIIQALKSIKDLRRKADDIQAKVAKYCTDLDCDTPTYPDQKKQIEEWCQAHNDILVEILDLRTRIQRTNLATSVTIELGGKQVTKSIAAWVHRRKDLAKLQESFWSVLTDKGLPPLHTYQLRPESPKVTVQRRHYYDPAERDTKVELYRSEPSKIDGTLEVINAVTDLLGDID